MKNIFADFDDDDGRMFQKKKNSNQSRISSASRTDQPQRVEARSVLRLVEDDTAALRDKSRRMHAPESGSRGG
jgi:hypothetical protein